MYNGYVQQRGKTSLMRSYRKVLALLLVSLLSSLLGIVPSVTAAQNRPVIVVNAAAAGGMLTTRLSTNLTEPYSVSRRPGAQAKLAAYAPPLVRLHVGTVGQQQGNWNFAPLDDLVNTVRAYGGEPIMNVRYAPEWMWTCTTFHGIGDIKDLTFTTFADYMARLVSYYNTGSMTTESGTVITNPAGTKNRITHWEIWNEPSLSNETPCRLPNNGPALTPDRYVTMWNAVVPKMRAVDPTIKFVGPALDDALTDRNLGYVPALMARATYKPDAISYHVYGGWENRQSDREIFDGSNLVWGLRDITGGVDRLKKEAPGIPIWISELNVNADYATDPAKRPWTGYGVAWGASAFRLAALKGVSLIRQFEFVSTPQFGQVDAATGAPTLPYWRDRLLSQAFPAGSTILSSSSSQAEIESLAVRRPDGTLSG